MNSTNAARGGHPTTLGDSASVEGPEFPTQVLDRLHSQSDAMLNDLCDWLRIASVSSDSGRRGEVDRAAQWVYRKLASAGLRAERITTTGNDLVYAETPPVAGAPVVLVYGHYDVQPAEPLEQWISGPFEPTLRDGNVYARGATDDKGQVLTHIQSVLQWVSTGMPLPLQIKFLIEGEEEVGSEGLEGILPSLHEKLRCDCVVISDNSQYGDGQPAITYGLRGIVAMEIRVDGPRHDLHSGSFGGAVMNPAIALCHLLSSMVDRSGRITVEGFYDDVASLDERERETLGNLPVDDEAMAAAIGTDCLFGEAGYTNVVRRWARPTFDINGLTSGHQGEGGKTIIPATASAKFTCRLVPDQDPEMVFEAIERHLHAALPPGVRLTIVRGHGAPAMVTAVDSPFIFAAKRAIAESFGIAPVMIREGGSIPIVAKFQSELGADCLLLGWGLDDDGAHSPNEKFRIADYHRGIEASARLWHHLASIGTP